MLGFKTLNAVLVIFIDGNKMKYLQVSKFITKSFSVFQSSQTAPELKE